MGLVVPQHVGSSQTREPTHTGSQMSPAFDYFWSHTSGPVKTRFTKQEDHCFVLFCFFYIKQLGGHLKDIKGLTHPFTYMLACFSFPHLA